DDYSGCAVASGDVNGDGYDDLIIGAWGASSGAGETYVIFGASSPPTEIDLSTTSANITVCGDYWGDYSGYAVASGDVNGDGYDDIIIGAYRADPVSGRDNAGETYVIFGSSPSSPVTIDLSTTPADITVCGDYWGDYSGYAVASGDVDADGYDDLIIGVPLASPGGRTYAGETYLIAGGGAFITAHGLGGKSWIKQFSLLANGLNSFKAFGAVNSQGEVHLALGDVDADSLDEIAAGQGEGAKSWVKFFEVNGSPISGFKAFGASNINGELHLSIGNFDADISDSEIAIAQGEGGQSWVKVFEVDGTFLRAFKAFGAANAQGEVHLATGDLNKDGIDEIIAGMGEGGSSRVKIFNRFGNLIRSFLAFEPADNPGGEVRLVVGNFDADPAVEIAAATGYNGGNKVRLFDKHGNIIGKFTAFGFGGNTNGDVQIAASDIDNDGVDELICAHGEGGSSQVKVFKANGTAILSFKAFGGVNAQGEVHLGRSNY
ncbi:MAG: FG-GAP repeat protein, partial [Acidobacteriota bacterium]